MTIGESFYWRAMTIAHIRDPISTVEIIFLLSPLKTCLWVLVKPGMSRNDDDLHLTIVQAENIDVFGGAISECYSLWNSGAKYH